MRRSWSAPACSAVLHRLREPAAQSPSGSVSPLRGLPAQLRRPDGRLRGVPSPLAALWGSLPPPCSMDPHAGRSHKGGLAIPTTSFPTRVTPTDELTVVRAGSVTAVSWQDG